MSMHRQRFTKIVATLGPGLVEPASGCARCSRPAPTSSASTSATARTDDHAQRVELLRALEKEYKHPIAILMDLQGPKLRLGTFAKGPMELKKGQKLRLDMDQTPGTAKRVPLPHPEIFKAAKPDGLLLIDDGKVRLRIVAHTEDTIDTEVEVAGHDQRPQGRQPAQPRAAAVADDDQGPQGPRPTACRSASTGWRSPSCSTPTTSPS